MLRLAVWISPNFKRLARTSSISQLVGISFSHYVEFARWCLQYKKKIFVEHSYAPGEHVLPALSLRLGDRGGAAHLSQSSRMLAVPADGASPTVMSDRQLKKKGATALPALITSGGDVLSDSWEIAEYAGFEPVDKELKHILDEELGPLSRQLTYAYILKDSNSAAAKKLFLHGAGLFWRVIWHLGFGHAFTRLMAKNLRSHDQAAVNVCRENLKVVFSNLDDRLKNKTTAYLGGDKPGAADFALAALACPVVGANDYCLGKYTQLFHEIEQRDADYLKEITYWRSTETGKYCLMMYETFRRECESP